MPPEDAIHINISHLWQHSREVYAEILTTTEWHHLMRCEHCGEILKGFYKSKSVDEANHMLKEIGIEAELQERQTTA